MASPWALGVKLLPAFRELRCTLLMIQSSSFNVTQSIGTKICSLLGVVVYTWPVIPALGRWKQEDQKFKASFSYRVSSRPGWGTRDPVLWQLFLWRM